MNKITKTSIAEILYHYGHKKQLKKTVEEATELSLSIQHYFDDKVDAIDVVTEIADMLIMCEQMKMVFGEQLVESEIERKTKRTIDGIHHTTVQKSN